MWYPSRTRAYVGFRAFGADLFDNISAFLGPLPPHNLAFGSVHANMAPMVIPPGPLQWPPVPNANLVPPTVWTFQQAFFPAFLPQQMQNVLRTEEVPLFSLMRNQVSMG
jgi:hypothetical protein